MNQAKQCRHLNYNDYFDKCPDCDFRGLVDMYGALDDADIEYDEGEVEDFLTSHPKLMTADHAEIVATWQEAQGA